MTEKEQLYTNHIHINRLAELFKNDSETFQQIENIIPLMMTSTGVDNFEFNFFNKEFADSVKKEKEFITAHGMAYTTSLLHPKNLEYVLAAVKKYNYLEHKDNVFEYYQYVRPEGDKHYEWLICYKKFISKDQYFGIYHKIVDLGVSGLILRDYLGDIAMSLSSYQKFQSLTQKEREILQLIISGKINKEIANLSHISINTVRTHRNRIWKKLDIKHFKDCLKYQLLFNDTVL